MKQSNLTIKVIHHDNGQLQIECNEAEWQNPFELLWVLNYVKTSLEVKLVQGQQQLSEHPKEKCSSKEIRVGDFMKCIRLNVQSKHNSFTLGNLYEVIDVDKDYRGRTIYFIYDDNKKKRFFQAKDSQFALCS
ncbi:MAG TPA: hypothetical protein VJ602_04935 [Paludibacter sp.]|nr:hypothetical protein [Paludibacter sp.]